MSKDSKPDRQDPLAHRAAANDNTLVSNTQSPWGRLSTEEAPSSLSSSGDCRFPRILTDWPERLPVIQAESDLIVAYLSELIGEIIANDNSER